MILKWDGERDNRKIYTLLWEGDKSSSPRFRSDTDDLEGALTQPLSEHECSNFQLVPRVAKSISTIDSAARAPLVISLCMTQSVGGADRHVMILDAKNKHISPGFKGKVLGDSISWRRRLTSLGIRTPSRFRSLLGPGPWWLRVQAETASWTWISIESADPLVKVDLKTVLNNGHVDDLEFGPKPPVRTQDKEAKPEQGHDPAAKEPSAAVRTGDPAMDRLLASLNDPQAMGQALTALAQSPDGQAFRAEGQAQYQAMEAQQVQAQAAQQAQIPPPQQAVSGPVMTR